MNRRQLLKTGGIGLVASLIGACCRPILAGPGEAKVYCLKGIKKTSENSYNLAYEYIAARDEQEALRKVGKLLRGSWGQRYPGWDWKIRVDVNSRHDTEGERFMAGRWESIGCIECL